MHLLRERVEPTPELIARKKKAGLCISYRCTKAAQSKNVLCAKHAWERRKRRDPIAYIFHHRRQRAKERGYEWTITLDNFRDWCNWTRYHLKTGRTADSESIERKLNHYGYHIWNITTLTLAQNSAKGQKPHGGYYETDAAGVTHYVAPTGH